MGICGRTEYHYHAGSRTPGLLIGSTITQLLFVLVSAEKEYLESHPFDWLNKPPRWLSRQASVTQGIE